MNGTTFLFLLSPVQKEHFHGIWLAPLLLISGSSKKVQEIVLKASVPIVGSDEKNQQLFQMIDSLDQRPEAKIVPS